MFFKVYVQYTHETFVLFIETRSTAELIRLLRAMYGDDTKKDIIQLPNKGAL